MGLFAIGLALGASTLGVDAIASVDDRTTTPPALVRWTGDVEADCPSAAEVDTWIERALGHPPAEHDALREVAIAVTRDPEGGLRASLRLAWEDEVEHRTLRGESCAAVARASALIVAVALDPFATAAEVFPEPEPASEPSPPPAPPTTPPPTTTEPTPPALPRSTWSHRLRLGGGIDYRTLPEVGGRVLVGYAATRGYARLDAGAFYRTPTTARYADRPAVGGTFQIVAASLRACPRLVAGRVELAVCGGTEIGTLRARGHADVPDVRWKLWLAGTVDATTAIDVGRRIAVVADFGTTVPILRPRFHVTGLPPLFRTGAVGLKALVGLEVRLAPPP